MIKQITAKETYKIRLEVLRNGINLPYKFSGDFKESTFHLGYLDVEEIVSIATFMRSELALLSSKKQYQLRGMATIKKSRKLGYGKKLLEQAYLILKEKHIDFLWCNARENALKFYLKNGFKIIGKPINITPIGKHYTMYKKISNKCLRFL